MASRAQVLFALLLPGCGGRAAPDVDALGAAADAAAAPDAIAPLDVPERAWTWVEVPGTACANGNPTGFGVNLAAASGDLFFYFEGGGACWSSETCFELGLAARVRALEDADEVDFAEIRPLLEAHPLFDRDDPTSPFAGATYVYVPYCTGDVYSGDRVVEYDDAGTARTVHHVGARNTQRLVDVLRSTLPGLARIWTVGSSAGGYGATLNHHRFVASWPAAEVHLLQDCSPPVTPIDGEIIDYQTWQTQWQWQLPPGCAGCDTDFGQVISAISAANPTSRVALLAYDEDAVVKAFFGYQALAPALATLLDTHYDQPSTHAFVLSSTAHTMLGNYAAVTQPGGPTLRAWVEAWATGGAAWVDEP